MNIHVKLSTTLRRHVPAYNPETGLDLDIPDTVPVSAADLAQKMALPLPEIKFIMLNGRCQPLDAILRDNDRVAYFPAVGGG